MTMSFIIIPLIQNYECRELIKDSAIHTSRFCLWSKKVELLHATRAHKVFCYSIAQSTGSL